MLLLCRSCVSTTKVIFNRAVDGRVCFGSVSEKVEPEDIGNLDSRQDSFLGRNKLAGEHWEFSYRFLFHMVFLGNGNGFCSRILIPRERIGTVTRDKYRKI